MVVLALVWPGLSAPVSKKKKSVKRPVVAAKKRVSAKKKVVRRPSRKGKRVASAKGPLNFATEPVKLELQACTAQDQQKVVGGLCLNCAEQALSTAKAFTGLRYVRGGTDPNSGFDCSGFVQHVYASSCGRNLPRTAHEQFAMGEAVDKSELQRGDLVFFKGRQGWHVGIYTGDNQFIHSPNRRESVRVSSLDTPYYFRSYKGARRISTGMGLPPGPEVTIPTNDDN
jgi:cell wall-associated NlpC family hydrolase